MDKVKVIEDIQNYLGVERMYGITPNIYEFFTGDNYSIRSIIKMHDTSEVVYIYSNRMDEGSAVSHVTYFCFTAPDNKFDDFLKETKEKIGRLRSKENAECNQNSNT